MSTVEQFDPTTQTLVLQQLQQNSPLLHCMTNDVVQTFTANVLLALGCRDGH